ncbi:hypothetical protein DOZ91_13595 [Peribacillus frigoritolerans]|nr:hypothetical protein DOZ91_13595 [Peribacillus frigoritolerans]
MLFSFPIILIHIDSIIYILILRYMKSNIRKKEDRFSVHIFYILLEIASGKIIMLFTILF